MGVFHACLWLVMNEACSAMRQLLSSSCVLDIAIQIPKTSLFSLSPLTVAPKGQVAVFLLIATL